MVVGRSVGTMLGVLVTTKTKEEIRKVQTNEWFRRTKTEGLRQSLYSEER